MHITWRWGHWDSKVMDSETAYDVWCATHISKDPIRETSNCLDNLWLWMNLILLKIGMIIFINGHTAKKTWLLLPSQATHPRYVRQVTKLIWDAVSLSCLQRILEIPTQKSWSSYPFHRLVLWLYAVRENWLQSQGNAL